MIRYDYTNTGECVIFSHTIVGSLVYIGYIPLAKLTSKHK